MDIKLVRQIEEAVGLECTVCDHKISKKESDNFFGLCQYCYEESKKKKSKPMMFVKKDKK